MRWTMRVLGGAALVWMAAACDRGRADPARAAESIFTGKGAEWVDLSYAYDSTMIL